VQRKTFRVATLVMAMAAVTAFHAEAATIRVEQDGSGDFTEIAAGILAASPGDTIRIGPGWYQGSAPFTTGGSTEETFVAVDVDSLTIIGEDRDTVLIGPDVPNFTTQGPRGIVLLDGVVTFARLESMTITNVGSAVFATSSFAAKEIAVVGCRRGFAFAFAVGIVLENVSTTNVDRAIIGGGAVSDVVVVGSEFRSCPNSGGVSFTTGVNGIVVEDSRFIDCAFQLSLGSTGNLRTSSFAGSESFVQLGDFSNLDMVGCTIEQALFNVVVNGESHVSGRDNVFLGGSVTTLLFTGSSTSSLTNNHIFRLDGSPVVLAEAYRVEPVQVDLRGNWWGTTNADSLRAWIVDGDDLDNPPFFDEFAEVLFEPFAPGPVSGKAESIGSFKSRFRD